MVTLIKRLKKSGGSSVVVLPKFWLEQVDNPEEVALEVGDEITIRPKESKKGVKA